MHNVRRSLFIAALLVGCGRPAEYVPPLRSLGEGVPADLPALGTGQWAVLRLVVNG